MRRPGLPLRARRRRAGRRARRAESATTGRASGRVRCFALYGETTGETDEFGLPVRYPWADDYRGRAMVALRPHAGPEAEWVNNTLCLDTGCVFGGRLTALRYPERELVSVPARAGPTTSRPGRSWPTREPRRRAGAARTTCSTSTDVLGKRVVETAPAGRVTVREENAAGRAGGDEPVRRRPALAALPAADHGARRPRRRVAGLLEHPAEAFDAYRTTGVGRVVCEEKHMGSRAVVLVCRDAEAAAARFGAATARRRGLHPHRPAVLRRPTLDRGAARPARAPRPTRPGCGTSWAPTGCCSTPSCCRGPRRPRTCCATSTPRSAPRRGAALPAAVDGARARPRPAASTSASCSDRTAARAADADGVHAPPTGRYCWPTDGLDGVSAGAVPAAGRGEGGAREPRRTAGTSTSPTGWSPPTRELLRVTRRLVVDLDRRRRSEAAGDRLVGGADRRRRRGHGRQAGAPT